MEKLLAHTAHFLTLNFLLPKQREAQLTLQHHSLTPHPYPCVRLGSGAARAGMCQQIPFQHSQTIAALLLLEALYILLSLTIPLSLHPLPVLRSAGGSGCVAGGRRPSPGLCSCGKALIPGAAPRSHHPPPDVWMHQGAVPGLMFSGGI